MLSRAARDERTHHATDVVHTTHASESAKDGARSDIALTSFMSALLLDAQLVSPRGY